MNCKLSALKPQIFLLAGLLVVFTMASYGQDRTRNEEAVIKNTVKQIRPGLFECIIYLEGSKELLSNIDDVRYTLPSGYTNRKQIKKNRDSRYPFSSDPITTAEEVVVNIKIDYKGPNNAYLSYKLKIFTKSAK